MKIILSRKGFDSSLESGASASPIFPDGSMLSMPIPDSNSRQRYRDLRSPIPAYENLGQIVDLMPTRAVRGDDGVHLDPDLDANNIKRDAEWRALFGQAGAAQSHLTNAGVEVGDLFIMFGWFREAEERGGRILWRRGSPELHVIFGWMQVGEVINLGRRPTAFPMWASYHPHTVPDVYEENNALYVGSKILELPGVETDGTPGAGIFRKYGERRRLTAPDAHGRSNWRLPAWFNPSRAANALTYHPKPSQWRVFESHVELDTVGRGQEFVFDAAKYPEALEWFGSMVRGQG